jgi:hypothetical protein
MVNTLPRLVPSGYALDYTDFLRTKVDREGTPRLITGTVSVTSATSIGSYIGLAPFNKGAKLMVGASQIYTPILDTGTGLTMSVGYLYNDSSSAGANAASNSSAYSSSDSRGQTGGYISLTNSTAGSTGATLLGLTGTLQGDGWFVIQTGTGSTPTNQAAASISFQLAVAYDPSGMTN